jgi:hypothetical protein
MHTGFWRENVKKKECLELLDVDGRILNLFQETGWEVWAPVRDHWNVFMNMIMKFHILLND